MQIRLYSSACYENADQYIISADIILRKRRRFVVKSADFFITQKSKFYLKEQYFETFKKF